MNDKLRRLVGLAIVAGLLTGCNPKPPPPDQTVFDEQLEALDRARQVEEKLMDRAADIGERIDQDFDKEKEDPPQ